MKAYLILLFPFYLLMFQSCENDNTLNNQSELYDRIYFISFEFPSDTIGWYGYGMIDLVDDAPESGGNKSLLISGGCIIPHAYYDIGPQTNDCSVILKCWGKNLAYGGTISLRPDTNYTSIYISVSDSNWISYESKDTLYCPANKSLILELNSGGKIYSAMLVDLLEIRKVE